MQFCLEQINSHNEALNENTTKPLVNSGDIAMNKNKITVNCEYWKRRTTYAEALKKGIIMKGVQLKSLRKDIF